MIFFREYGAAETLRYYLHWEINLEDVGHSLLDITTGQDATFLQRLGKYVLKCPQSPAVKSFRVYKISDDFVPVSCNIMNKSDIIIKDTFGFPAPLRQCSPTKIFTLGLV